MVDGIGGACSIVEETRNACRSFAEKPDRKTPLGRVRQ